MVYVEWGSSLPTRTGWKLGSRIAAVFLVILSTSRSVEAAPPRITFESGAIVVSALTPGADIILFSLAREPRRYISEIVRLTKSLKDDDRDGVIRHSISTGAPRKSVWAAVDTKTGDYVVAAPPSFYLKTLPLSPAILKNDNNGQLRKLELPLGTVSALYIRPDAGSWTLFASEGSGTDEDRKPDHRLTALLPSFRPTSGALSPPEHFRKGDVLIIIEAAELRSFALRVGDL